MKDLQERIKWLEEGLNKLINHYSYNTVPKEVRDIAQSYLDGEPTTADEFNGDCMITYVDDRENNELLEL
tara:strand:- start:1210 stop:1419 length:210 start_codon:yes stop_codon:yes gene_type:complete